MPKKPESNFRAKVKRDLSTLKNIYVFPIQQISITGDPDFLICVRGFFVALELKSAKGKLAALQEFKLKKVVDAQGTSLVANPKNWEGVFSLIRGLSEG